jgi:starvation-inducible DNA-binding protein
MNTQTMTTAPNHTAEATHLGLSMDAQDQVANLLNTLLADYNVLAVKAKNYHWNIIGRHFQPLHGFFGELYDALSEDIDNIAERTRALGRRPLGNMAAFIEHATLQEETREGLKAEQMLKTLLKDQEAVIVELRKSIEKADLLGDAGSADFMTALLEAREKSAWMVRAFCQE